MGEIWEEGEEEGRPEGGNNVMAIGLQELVLEKESRIRESMLMMGLKQWILWSSWFVKQFIFLMITILVISILLRVRRKRGLVVRGVEVGVTGWLAQ